MRGTNQRKSRSDPHVSIALNPKSSMSHWGAVSRSIDPSKSMSALDLQCVHPSTGPSGRSSAVISYRRAIASRHVASASLNASKPLCTPENYPANGPLSGRAALRRDARAASCLSRSSHRGGRTAAAAQGRLPRLTCDGGSSVTGSEALALGRRLQRREEARRRQAARARGAAAAAPRQLDHLGDHRRQQADRGRRQAGGRPAPDLQLRRLRRPGDGQEVPEEVQREGPGRDLQLLRRGDREDRVRGGVLRPHHGPDRLEHGRPDRPPPAQAAQPLLLPEPREEHLARAVRPLLRPWRALHGPVRRLDGRHRLAQRQGQGGRREHGRPLGHLLAGAALSRPGGDPGRPPRRAEHADAARRDAPRRAAGPQHRGQGGRRQGAARPLGAQPDLQPEGRHHRLPDAARRQDGAAPLVVGRRARRRLLLHAQERPAVGALLLGARPERRGAERLLLRRPDGEEPGARARVHQLLPRRAERVRQLRELHRLHAAPEEHRRGRAAQARPDPQVAHEGGRAPGPVRRQPGAVAAERPGAAVLGRGLVAVQGRLMGGSRWTWRLVALPGVAWLSLFFLVALYAVVAVAFGNQDTLSQPVPFWNPLDWNVGYVLEVLKNLWHGDQFLTVSLRTLEFVAIAVVLSLLVGYPVAYFTARHAGRWKGLVLVGLILPLWINYLMRMLAWINLLAPDGLGTRALHTFGIEKLFLTIGLLAEPGGWLNGQPTTVILALVYGYLPFFILPLFVAIDRIDRRQIEAARDLGASPLSGFLRVTLPLSVPGILAGIVLIALPMFGDYYTADLVSSSTQTNMIGNQIDEFMRQGSEKVTGAALTLLLSAFLLVLMFYYLRTTRRAGTSAQTA